MDILELAKGEDRSSYVGSGERLPYRCMWLGRRELIAVMDQQTRRMHVRCTEEASRSSVRLLLGLCVSGLRDAQMVMAKVACLVELGD